MPEESRGAGVELTDLVKRYGSVHALAGVSLDMPAGEFVTLLGPSGSGKTTTLNMIAGFLQPDEGNILMNGKPIEDVPPHRRNIGMVFQNYALFPHMTAGTNVAFPLKQRKVPKAKIKTKVAEALSLVGLEGMADRYPRQLSGGQQQRVALARALVFEPSVLLMDEPLGALDKRLRESMQLEFKRIHQELGITFVYVTHDQDEALVMSDRIAVFNHGRIEQVGTAEDLYEQPSTLFVAQFLGDSNVLPGQVRGDRLVSDTYELVLRRSEAVPEGGSGVMIVRPERLQVGPVADGLDDGVNALSGRVYQVIYMGGTRRLEINLDVGVRVLAEESAGQSSGCEAGDRVNVTWVPDAAVVLPDEGRATAAGATGALTAEGTAADLPSPQAVV
jgi:putative spermidine/putrescine transport system ATP-binding protein